MEQIDDKKDEKKDENEKKFKISIKLNKYSYFPLEEIDGLIVIHSNKPEEFGSILDCTDFCFILTQKVGHMCNSNCMKIIKIDDKLINYDNIKGFDTTNGLEIPIKYKIPDFNNPKFYPSFRYFSNIMKCIISHTLSVEIPFLSNKSSTNIFIRKPPLEDKNEKNKNKEELNNFVFGDELIKKLFKNIGRLSYYIKTKKSISYKEKLPLEIYIDISVLGSIKIDSITIKIKKIIYLYDEHGNNNGEILEKDFDQKKIVFKNTDNNSIIKESLELPKDEFVPISIKDIHKPKLLEGKSNFTPPLKNILFDCNYFLIIYFKFESKIIKDKKIRIPIDLYDNLYYEQKKENNFDKSKLDIDEENNIGSINELNEEDNDNINNINNNKEEEEKEGFVIFENEDFMKAFQGKK